MDKLVYGPDVVYHPVGDIPLQRGGTPPNEQVRIFINRWPSVNIRLRTRRLPRPVRLPRPRMRLGQRREQKGKR
jgi:hypothetical protein